MSRATKAPRSEAFATTTSRTRRIRSGHDRASRGDPPCSRRLQLAYRLSPKRPVNRLRLVSAGALPDLRVPCEQSRPLERLCAYACAVRTVRWHRFTRLFGTATVTTDNRPVDGPETGYPLPASKQHHDAAAYVPRDPRKHAKPSPWLRAIAPCE